MTRILVVDDEPQIVRALTINLRARRYEVDAAYDGATALRMAADRHPDVVLLDLGLPVLNGFDVARQLSGNRPRKTPLLIAITGWGREEDRRNSRDSGIDLHLLKPVDPVALQCILTRFQALINGMRLDSDKDAAGWGC
jgi:two-component system KDP operon response regulator KdpE